MKKRNLIRVSLQSPRGSGSRRTVEKTRRSTSLAIVFKVLICGIYKIVIFYEYDYKSEVFHGDNYVLHIVLQIKGF